jgi:hypothetical protein
LFKRLLAGSDGFVIAARIVVGHADVAGGYQCEGLHLLCAPHRRYSALEVTLSQQPQARQVVRHEIGRIHFQRAPQAAVLGDARIQNVGRERRPFPPRPRRTKGSANEERGCWTNRT